MIIFDLSCEHQHRFEGWFHNAQAFEQQLADCLVCCPHCDSPHVRRIPSAVAIGSQRQQISEENRVAADPSSEPVHEITIGGNVAPSSRTQAMALYRQLAQAMEAISEDVGTSFADEARRMHYNEIPERPIRGQTSDSECEALQEEGIAVLRLPTIREEDLN